MENSITFVRRFHCPISNVYYIVANVGSYSLCLLQAQGALQMNEKLYRVGELERGWAQGVSLGPSGTSPSSFQASSAFYLFPPSSHNLLAEGYG